MTDIHEMVKVKCGACDGTGTCIECKGRIKTNMGASGEVKVHCSRCSGSGKCMNCNGAGDIWVHDNRPYW